MKTFKQFFNESLTESDDYYYHGTSYKNAENIMKYGLDPKKSLYSGKVYMTRNHGMAQKYSKDGKGNLGVVLKIHKDAIHSNHIKANSAGIVEYGDHIHPRHISVSE
ncbi:hypothetical protein [Caulobacter phage Cr30]|uniref:hypothetical protein n=1 Tax=Caulobacter phage Cr30 TaxID=1357714 RepID=UPI0004A9B563|nr:hypothetical protein OZ74_gp060 [Caulobacter phage Cr30]AGS80945.1 hypothetical protein [Caulobacter phage Cr30]